MRVVLDSNVLLAIIGRNSQYKLIWDAFKNRQFQLLVSDDILYEYEEILHRNSADGAAYLVMEIFVESPNVIFQTIYYSWNAIVKDADDNKFFDIAIAGNADYLVTNDAHFNVVKNLPFPSVKIISAQDFLKVLSN